MVLFVHDAHHFASKTPQILLSRTVGYYQIPIAEANYIVQSTRAEQQSAIELETYINLWPL